MHLDVVDLRDFYASRLGQVARRFVRRKLRELWPDVKGQRILGLGFATPFLRPFLDEAESVVALMPASQGVTQWPAEGRNRVALADEFELPLGDASIDRVLLVHGLETSEAVRPLLRQVWRVLTSSGRLMVLAPNRRSLWAQIETTPFAQGHPYSKSQLSRLLRECMFTPEGFNQALYMPPFMSRFLIRNGSAWESTGARFWPGLAGVIFSEATKQLYAPATPAKRVPARVRILRPVQGGVATARGKDLRDLPPESTT
jgi:SAM-dependent methyltransferase